MVSAEQLRKCLEHLNDATLMRIIDDCQYKLNLKVPGDDHKQVQLMYNVAREILK
jgi:hypothetical protein